VLALFAMLVAGIMASWFWSIGREYLHDPSAGLLFGSPTGIAVRLVLGITLAPHCVQHSAGVAAALTFVPVYKEIAQAGSEMWVSYLVAFQNGFFWEAALNAVVRHFTG
jgi:hypothetical protein